ncbi:hypothetical protein [Acetobacter pasteurianus]|uniref:hypothetical protein n=1 Tax=Acetobacter pasteurianus TaxID=438 RepID=UPI0012DAF0B9|nr:hypothetical protein [Acetobacter pasteurianus]
MRIIDLNKNGSEHDQDSSNLLQNEAFARLGTLIDRQLADLAKAHFVPPSGKELTYLRSHQSILIEGGRGSGKTTFLLNALHGLAGVTNIWANDLSRNLHVLPVIDPTLIETKEHIIIVIISLIDAALDDLRSAPDADRSKVDEARTEMAEGLGLLDGIGKATPFGEEWEDATWIMSRGLRKAAKGRLFEVKFQKYIYEALKVLNKTAFVLAFDDVDTNFELGRTILETIRKYLTSPQLVLMISGDLELYGRLVRRNIYDTFGDAIMKYDPSVIRNDRTGTSDAIRELEEQYLLKIVPPQNRIAMLSLGGILQTVSADEIGVIPSGGVKQEPLQQWASIHLRRLLLEKKISSEGKSTVHPFFELISREHLRLVIGYLRALGNQNTIFARRAIFTVFETRLRLAGIDPLELAHATSNDVLLITFRWLVSRDEPVSLGRFSVPSNADDGIVIHCLALAIAQSLEGSPTGCLKTLLTLNLPISMMQRGRYTQQKVRKAMLEFIWDDASPDLLNVAGRIGSIARLNSGDSRASNIGNMEASCFGSVGTKKTETRTSILKQMFEVSKTPQGGIKSVSELDTNMKPKDPAFSAQGWVRNLMKDATIAQMSANRGIVWFSLDDLIGRCGPFGSLLDLISYDRFNYRGEQHSSVSALSLLAAITKILAAEDIHNLDAIALTSIIPAFVPGDETSAIGQLPPEDEPLADDEDDADAPQANASTEFTEFLESLKAWHQFSRQYAQGGSLSDVTMAELSPSNLSRISERIHDQLVALDDEVTAKWKTGHILHRQITNVLHALLASTSGITGRLEAPKSSDRPFVHALRRVKSDQASAFHPLAAIIISCPLVWAFLNPDEHYAASGSTTDFLRKEVTIALNEFQISKGSNEVPFDSKWLEPPTISIAIGRANAANPRIVKQNGFFDLLNVVPRYYPTVRR